MGDKQEKALIEVIEQKIILFMDDKLVAARATDGDVYVSVGHLSDALALDRQGQTQRIERNSVLLSGYRRGEITTSGGPQQVYFLRVDLVPFWLAGVNTQRIKDVDRRQRVEQYQQNVAKVLWEAFQEGRLTADSTFDELLQTADEGLVQAYQMAQAIVQLARNQILLDSRMTQAEQRLDTLEAQLGNPEKLVTPDQASQISQAVKAVALALGKKTKRNEFGACYGELYRRYGITSYKALPVHKFEDALNFLTEWHQNITTDTPF